jgi:hypothetical protein
MKRNLWVNLCLAVLSVVALVSCVNPASRSELPDPNAAFGGTPHTIPGRVEAEHYDEGDAGVAYADSDVKNHGADYRGVTQVDIEQRSDASNGYGIGWTRAGEWLAYSVEVKKAGRYTVEFPVASNKKGGRFHLEIAGRDVSGPIEIPDTGSWQKLVMISKQNVELPAGRFVLKLVMDSDGESGGIGDIDYMEFRRANSD